MPTRTIVEYDVAVNVVRLKVNGTTQELSSSQAACIKIDEKEIEIRLERRRVIITGDANFDHYRPDENVFVIAVEPSSLSVIEKLKRLDSACPNQGGRGLVNLLLGDDVMTGYLAILASSTFVGALGRA